MEHLASYSYLVVIFQGRTSGLVWFGLRSTKPSPTHPLRTKDAPSRQPIPTTFIVVELMLKVSDRHNEVDVLNSDEVASHPSLLAESIMRLA